MIRDFRLKELGYDFMGYKFYQPEQLSFHHLIIPRRNCRKYNIPNNGYVYWNGAILRQDTSHDYLHVLERYDYDRFLAISSELIDINIQKQILYKQLCYINDILNSFEKEYSGVRNGNGHEIIKEKYTRRLVKNESRRI